MKKLVILILVLLALFSLASCGGNKIEEVKNNLPETFDLIIYEEDKYGYVTHKVIYNTETKLYHEYIYYYYYDGTYRNIKSIDYIVYDQQGLILKAETQTEKE